MHEDLAGPQPVTLTDDEVRRLGEGHLLVRDGFLGEEAARACAARLGELPLSPAALGRVRADRPSLRGDLTCWYDDLPEPGPLRALYERMEALRLSLNPATWLGLRDFELQLACYPGEGTRYVAHRDAFARDPNRRLTAILYLNEDWRPEHGGQLRAWQPDGEVLVEPVLDRLVFFLSEAVVHEVLPTWAPRLAATAWFRGP